MPGVGNMPAQTVDGQQAQREQQRLRRSGIRNMLAMASNNFILAYL